MPLTSRESSSRPVQFEKITLEKSYSIFNDVQRWILSSGTVCMYVRIHEKYTYRDSTRVNCKNHVCNLHTFYIKLDILNMYITINQKVKNNKWVRIFVNK